MTLRTTGAGPRDITVGYVVAAPLWKASYRVVLPDARVDHARVQGWAVLENQSGADWSTDPRSFVKLVHSRFSAFGRAPERPQKKSPGCCSFVQDFTLT